MIDHVLMFADEATAIQALPNFRVPGDRWDPSCTISDVKIVVQDAVLDTTDPLKPVVATPQQVLPGWWIAITLTALSQDFIALPDSALRLAYNRDTGQFSYMAPDLNQALLQTAKIEPAFAGVTDPFGG